MQPPAGLLSAGGFHFHGAFMLAILILAAGRSSRMGEDDKLLQVVDGAPLVATMVARARASGSPVYAALPPDRPARWQALSNSGAVLVNVPDAAKGMGHSIAGGVAALPDGIGAVMILPADMPEITSADIATLCTAWEDAPQDGLLRATSQDGKPGHPVIFPRRCFEDLKALSEDQGARSVLSGEKPHLVALPDRHALTDLDTPEDWHAWRAAQELR
ncbi:nucleotidyltransferase family protein [Shimia sp. CNT1-13L.2]|uniref:nucleotidyltransferase family protein n=1 Tax=Shimia sp. CNT1-13L.2 TaxID=2959663 RepID=UPI0020CCC38A|nr:nucleotidyltransferase family protein [Shimia sp. CNT1-13L.2]MCP9483052.1 nucleotidyltransferase family protein [Shimia sp. CNT1-13L.2]